MANPFQKIIDKGLGMFSSSSSDAAIGIDIGTSSIKVVQIKKKSGRAVLETYGSLALGPYAEVEAGKVTNLTTQKVAEALAEVLTASGTSTKSSGIAIPSQSSLVFILELPPQLKESDLPNIVPTEARKYIPVPIGEVSIDYFLLPKKQKSFEEENNPDAPKMEEEKNQVLVVAIQNEAVSKYQEVSKACGLDVGFFELEIFSSVRANFEHELSPVLVLDFGASKVKLSIIEFGSVKSFHTVARGSHDISQSISQSLGIPFKDGEEMKKEFGLFENPSQPKLPEIIKSHLQYIFSETNGVLLEYEKKSGKTISKVILSGGGSMMKGFIEVASNNFTVPVEMANPFSKVHAPAFLEKVLKASGPEFAVAIGLALRKLG